MLTVTTPDLGCSDRESSILRELACFRYLNTAQLEDIVFGGSQVKPHPRSVGIRRILGSLRRRGLIAASPRLVGGPTGGSARLVYALTEPGERLAARLDPTCSRRPARGRLFVGHSLMIADVALAFRQAARAHPGHELSQWTSDWQIAVQLGSAVVVPDGHLVYRTPSWEVDAFVEVDLGSERPSRFAQKIVEYLELYRSGTWRAGLAAWPLVLTITTDRARATGLRRVTEDVLRKARDAKHSVGATEFDFAAGADVLGEGGPLGEIWQVAGQTGVHALIPAGEPLAPRMVAETSGDSADAARTLGAAPLPADTEEWSSDRRPHLNNRRYGDGDAR